MKSLSHIIPMMLIVATFVLSGCGKDGVTVPETERVGTILTSVTWQVSQVMIDKVDKTNQFTGLTLKFTTTNYTTTNGKVVWPASGTWKFKDDTAKAVLRSDDVEVTIVEVTDTSLKLSFNWSTGTFGPGRAESVAGEHVFTFIRS